MNAGKRAQACAGCVAAALAAVLLLVPAAPPAGGEEIERVVAVVDDEPVLKSEIEAQLEIAIQSLEIDRSNEKRIKELRRQILDQQIEQLVLYEEAIDQEIPIDEAEIDLAVEDAIQRNKQELGSEQLFQRQLELEGLTEEQLRERYRRQARIEMLVGRLVQRELAGEITVSEEEVRRYYEENKADLPLRDTAVRLQHIAIAVRPDSILLEKARDLALEVAGKIINDELTFAEAARRYSDDPNASEGGDLRRVRRGDFAGGMGQAFEDAIFALETGELSAPIPSPLGYHLVRVDEKDPAGAWVHPRHILFRVPVVQADRARAEARAEEIYAEAAAGEPFAELARRYSGDPETAARGGDLGWIPVGSLTDKAAEVIPTLDEGEVSEPIQTEGFYHIFRVADREAERAFAYDEVAEELAEMIRSQKREARYQEWVEDIKEKHYIERRPWGEN